MLLLLLPSMGPGFPSRVIVSPTSAAIAAGGAVGVGVSGGDTGVTVVGGGPTIARET